MNGNAHAAGQGAQIEPQNPSVMTPALGFEEVWRDLQPRIVAMLVRRGTAKDVAEDVAQETAIRLLKNWHLLDETRPTWPFARRVALNCLVDRHRREHFDTVGNLPDREGPHDVEEHSLARFRLTEVWRAMAGLTQKERSILLAEVGIAGGHVNDSATKMARYRARQKLTAAVGRSGAFSGVPLAWRRLTGWVQVHSPAYVVDVGTAAGLAVIVSAAAVTWVQPGHAATKPQVPAIRSEHVSLHRVETRRTSDRIELPRPHPTGQRDQAASTRTGGDTPQPPQTQPAEQRYSAEAGPARAETGQDGGAVYVQVCVGEDTQTTEDDLDVTVVVYDDTENQEDDETPACDHGGQGENP